MILLTGPPTVVSGPSKKEKCFRYTNNKGSTKNLYVILERLSVTQWLGLGLKGIIWKVYKYDTIDKDKNICNLFGPIICTCPPPPRLVGTDPCQSMHKSNQNLTLISAYFTLWWACWINKLIYCLIYFHSFLLWCLSLLLKGVAISLNTPQTNQTGCLKLKLRTPTLTVYRTVLVSSRAYLPKNRQCNHSGS